MRISYGHLGSVRPRHEAQNFTDPKEAITCADSTDEAVAINTKEPGYFLCPGFWKKRDFYFLKRRKEKCHTSSTLMFPTTARERQKKEFISPF